MSRIVLLDTGPLGMIVHPKPNPAIGSWLEGLLQSGVRVIVPEIADWSDITPISPPEENA